jgi:hypothetical protein
MSKKTPSNIIRVRKNKRRPARQDIGMNGDDSAKRMSTVDQRAINHSVARFKRAMDTTNATSETGLRGLDLMVNVNYYKEHGCLPENCGMGMKNPKVS